MGRKFKLNVIKRMCSFIIVKQRNGFPNLISKITKIEEAFLSATKNSIIISTQNEIEYVYN